MKIFLKNNTSAKILYVRKLEKFGFAKKIIFDWSSNIASLIFVFKNVLEI